MDTPAPPSETEGSPRLARLRALGLLGTPAEEPFEDLVRTAAALCGTPAGGVRLIGEWRLWFSLDQAAGAGCDGPAPEDAFWRLVLDRADLLEVNDAALDPCFAQNALVTASEGLRFYAGVPITLDGETQVGVLAVADALPRELSPMQRQGLSHLAAVAAAAVRARQQLQALADFRHLATLVQHSEDAIIGKSLDSMIVSWNEGAEELFGYSRQEILGQPITTLFPPGHADEENQLMRRVRAGETVREFHTVRRRKDGRLIEVAVNLAPILDTEQHIVGVAKTARDISVQKASERALAASEARYRALVEEQAELVSLSTPDGTLSFVNSAYARHFGRTREQMVGTSLYDYIPPEERAAVAAHLHAVCTSRRQSEGENRMLSADGNPRWMAWTNVGLCDETGRVVTIHSVGRDITERRAVAEALRSAREEIARQNELLRVTLASIGEGVITCDAAARVTWMNVVAERMTGWSSHEALGRQVAEVFPLVDGTTRVPLPPAVVSCLALGEAVAAAPDSTLVARDGVEYGVEESVAPIRTGNGQLVGAVMMFRDVSEQRRVAGEMRFRATHDALTGVYNRGEFDLRLGELLQRVHARGGVHALLFVDLDYFKAVNDRCGHEAGDRLLRQIARLFGECVRSRDVLARLGGDEFGILLEDCAPAQAERIGAEIIRRLAEFRFMQDDACFMIGASIGLVIIDAQAPAAELLMRRADQACYAAKAAGRQRVTRWRAPAEAAH